MDNQLHKNGILTGHTECVCLACDVKLEGSEVKGHIHSKEHSGNFEKTALVQGLESDGIRKVKRGYFCEVCNIVSLALSKTKVHVTTALHVDNKQRPKEKNHPQLDFKVTPDGVIAFDCLKIATNPWNAIIENTCAVCDIDVDDNGISQHIELVDHAVNLIQAVVLRKYYCLYRKIDTFIQCLTCNMLMPEGQLEIHVESASHDALFNTACDGRIVKKDIQNYDLNKHLGMENYILKQDASTRCFVCNWYIKRDPKEHLEHFHHKTMLALHTKWIEDKKNENLFVVLPKEEKSFMEDTKIKSEESDNGFDIHMDERLDSEEIENGFGKNSLFVVLPKEEKSCKEHTKTNKGEESDHDFEIDVNKRLDSETTENGFGKNTAVNNESGEHDGISANAFKVNNNDVKINTETQNGANGNLILQDKAQTDKNKTAYTVNGNPIHQNTEQTEENKTANKNAVNGNTIIQDEKQTENTLNGNPILQNKQQTEENYTVNNAVNGNQSTIKEQVKENVAIPVASPSNDADSVRKLADEFALFYKSEDATTCSACQETVKGTIEDITAHVNSLKHKKNTLKTTKLLSTNYETFRMRDFSETSMLFHNVARTDMIVGNKFSVTLFSYHVYVDVEDGTRCYLCNKLVDEKSLLQHSQTDLHKRLWGNSLVITSFERDFVREVNKGIYHCGFCNIIFKRWDALLTHLLSRSHMKYKMVAEMTIQRQNRNTRGLLLNIMVADYFMAMRRQ